MTAITMTDDEWTELFRPMTNPIDDNASCGGCMFETFGDDLAFVLKQNPLCVWTYQDDDNGIPCITSGYHLVNRIGYFVTEKPFDEDQDIYVTLDYESHDDEHVGD
ncbi:hypothetical protein UFOVP235_2 [uncultured Caudovirales phage]|uniref:Uncharacterized protein n=1 Tax=uncultured Caudovirales phage TaxID=2100421 RepID=A0A6J7WR09_9CAUD|nr:hypothetical protein UFOVP235_2 [uncultured Caudovirales phage]